MPTRRENERGCGGVRPSSEPNRCPGFVVQCMCTVANPLKAGSAREWAPVIPFPPPKRFQYVDKNSGRAEQSSALETAISSLVFYERGTTQQPQNHPSRSSTDTRCWYFERQGSYVGSHCFEKGLAFACDTAVLRHKHEEFDLEMPRGYTDKNSPPICAVRFDSVQSKTGVTLETMTNAGEKTRLLQERHEETSIQPVERPFIQVPGERIPKNSPPSIVY